ncbi:signal transduction histidine kinase [Caldimonas thermodepolymerans]|uniref:histidine kinase n=2 Tax=Caldimonas thermodepolymerans TaxID=215580 RepID=A0AA46DC41_9BURK|nr:signal transduction histidine kinase [Caldimonas thermodepolymerans]TCP06270.1 signal transduction histidine kinase [Caldimonas thermodepolymerans]
MQKMDPMTSAASAAVPPPAGEAPQRVIKVRRDYNSWVASETLEDYALRFTPRSFRKWSELRVAQTGFGGAASFLVLEAVGATLLVEYGFLNAFWAIIATGLIIFLAGLPISLYAARHGVDMDLLTRGAGFGYIGSTITSLIYASFTFIFFALEAAIMAYALELAFDIPPAWGYLVCALLVIPLVTHGVTMISRLQVWTQPLWLVLLVLPFVYVFREEPDVLRGLVQYGGQEGGPARFDLLRFGAAMTVGIALMTQMGEQADYLRFMPEKTARNRGRWWAGVLLGGPGWVVPGIVKMLGGALLAYLAISHSVPVDRAVDPNQMYLVAYGYVSSNVGWAVAATAVFVVISQLKINVTNAYAGSLAWSNFFARVTHSHPGRVVWVVFNTLIALMLMELNVFQALGKVLGLYSNIAISWMMAVVADLVVNKPLGLSPPGIEFKRAHLYDVNPVGVGAMGIASVLSVAANLGYFGPTLEAFSALIALVTAFVAAPTIAWLTRGRYYLARPPEPPQPQRQGLKAVYRCTVCEGEYERDDMARCPAYQGMICSLCCSLDARCHDLCKSHAHWSAQWLAAAKALLPRPVWARLNTELGHFLLLMMAIVPALGVLLMLVYHQELRGLGPSAAELEPVLRLAFVKVYAALVVVSGVVAWWLVLAHKSRQVAQEESNRQTHLLMREIESHRRTDEQLQQAKRQAEQANQAKSRYISAISHELRTPLNSILGYAQLLDEDASLPPHRRQAVTVIRRAGDHLLSLIEGTLDIARIESGKLTLEVRPMRFAECVQQIARMFELQAAGKGIAFETEFVGTVPEVVRADEKRLRQILLNVLGNAVKFTRTGRVVFRLKYAREIALFEIEDTGPGIAPEEIGRIFEPFARGSAAGTGPSGGTGLGLTISKMLTDLMGGEMTVSSEVGRGTLFRIRLFLPQLHAAVAEQVLPPPRTGYLGARRRILVVDNEEDDRGLLLHLLQPLGFELAQAESGDACLALLRRGDFAPDAIFMDLAMPGIDGWETIRTIRREGLSDAHVAIVSANAFDQGLDNDVGITPADFFVKPVRIGELLDWLGRRLQLEWTEAPRVEGPGAPAPAAAAQPVVPPEPRLLALQEAIDLGYFRGILKLLDEIEAEDARHAPFVQRLRELARQFQLDAMTHVLRQARHDRLAA